MFKIITEAYKMEYTSFFGGGDILGMKSPALST
jgi:hypothetical protein